MNPRETCPKVWSDSQTLHACMNYSIREKINLKFVWSSKYNWLIDDPNCNCCSSKKYDHSQLDVRGIWPGFVHWQSIRSVSVARASEKFLNSRPTCEVSSSGRAIPYIRTSEPTRLSSVVQSVGIAKSSDCLLDNPTLRAACPLELMPKRWVCHFKSFSLGITQ